MDHAPGTSGLPDDLHDSLATSFFIRFTATGRRTGLPRTSETTFVWDGSRTLYVSGYPGRRDWVANLAAHPDVTVHTVERGVFYDIPGRARVLRDRRERTPRLLAFLARWADRPEAPRRIFNLVLGAIALNRHLHLPWWGPFYLVRRLFDRMPCVEIVFVGPPVRRRGPPPEPSPHP